MNKNPSAIALSSLLLLAITALTLSGCEQTKPIITAPPAPSPADNQTPHALQPNESKPAPQENVVNTTTPPAISTAPGRLQQNGTTDNTWPPPITSNKSTPWPPPMNYTRNVTSPWG